VEVLLDLTYGLVQACMQPGHLLFELILQPTQATHKAYGKKVT
jgi:hypothetical protein